jgi:CheY-like chemotaxis protein
MPASRCAPTEDGQQAVAAFAEWHPDLILMDMRMPVLDGYAGHPADSRPARGRPVKIVALTASAFREERDAILAAGCDEMVHKPIEGERLFEVMGELLGLRFQYEEPTPLGAGHALGGGALEPFDGPGAVALHAFPLHVHEAQAVLGQGQAGLGRPPHVLVGQQRVGHHAEAVLGHDRHAVLGVGVALIRQRREDAGGGAEGFGLEGGDAAVQLHLLLGIRVFLGHLLGLWLRPRHRSARGYCWDIT